MNPGSRHGASVWVFLIICQALKNFPGVRAGPKVHVFDLAVAYDYCANEHFLREMQDRFR